MLTVSRLVVLVATWLFVVAAACDDETGPATVAPARQSGSSEAEISNAAQDEPFERPQARQGAPWRPDPHHAQRPLVAAGPGLLAYNPHRGLRHAVRGSGHTHASPDHSNIDAAAQQRRLGALGDAHRHHFLWMTAHDVVVADPGVDGVLHLYGTEIYADEGDNDVGSHMLALLPDDALVGHELPFGRYRHRIGELAQRIAAARGLSVLAHPVRYSPERAEVERAPAALWGLEAISRNTDIAGNLEYVDARLSAGHYTCLSAGADIHDEDWSTTMGYQVVGVRSGSPTREEVFGEVAACNFFACTVRNVEATPFGVPSLSIDEGVLRFDAGSEAARIVFVGPAGRVLATQLDSQAATLSLASVAADAGPDDPSYVRVEAHRPADGAVCLSQPVWLLSSDQ